MMAEDIAANSTFPKCIFCGLPEVVRKSSKDFNYCPHWQGVVVEGVGRR